MDFDAQNLTESENISWFSRIKDSIKGIIFGLVMFLGAFVLLFWNEGRAVKTAKRLAEGQSKVISVSLDKVITHNNKALIHITGEATTETTLQDHTFKISQKALKFRRIVEMYQWEEEKETKTKKKIGGGKKRVVRYKHRKVWASHLIDSKKFRIKGYDNPARMPYSSKYLSASDVKVGAFYLSNSLVSKISNFTQIRLSQDTKNKLPQALKNKVQLHNNSYYIGDLENGPKIGDIRITFSVVKPTPVSIVAKQLNNRLTKYTTKYGDIELLSIGTVDANTMFERELASNTFWTWMLRLIGFIVMVIGLCIALNPIAVLGDVIPFVGNILGAGIFIASLLISLVFTLLTIAIAWLFFRPVLAIILLAIAGGVVFWLKSKKAKTQPQT